mmetsp:Transcript_7655/g.11368  ORF Transcript_7655/g.11368 Transcript_7655/m.11368 type:complete len:636 (-) Transcript_7655:53-1960(-)
MSSKDPKQKLPGYYTKLDGYITKGNNKKISSTIKKILKITPNDPLANEIYGLALLNMGKYHEASHYVNEPLSKAYSFYKQNFLEDAAKEMEKVSDQTSLQAKHLSAQIAYKRGLFKEAQKIYEELMKLGSDSDSTIATNLTAAYSAGGQHSKSTSIMKNSSNQTYGLTYNAACSYIDEGKYKRAEKMLVHSIAKCNEEGEKDGLTKEEIESDLAPMKTQMAYLKQMKGEAMAAYEDYKTVIASKPEDSISLAVASNNIISVSPTSMNMFDIEKRLKGALSSKVLRALSSSQRNGIQFNHVLLLIKKKKYEECNAIIKELTNDQEYEALSTLIQGAIAFSQDAFDEAIQLFKNYIKQHGPHFEKRTNEQQRDMIKVVLSLAQLHISRGHVREAISVIQTDLVNLGHYRFEPSMVAALISLLKRDPENHASCIKTFQDAIAFWENKDDEKLNIVLSAFADFLIEHDEYELAQKSYQQMIDKDPTNQNHVAGFVLACSKFDIEKAEKIRSQMVPSNALEGASLDLGKKLVEKYDSQLGSMLEADTMKTALEVPNEEDLELVQKKAALRKARRKRRKKNPRPKNFDPNYVVDPHRWEPKSKRVNKKDVLAGKSNRHQGGITDESLDRRKNQKTKRHGKR